MDLGVSVEIVSRHDLLDDFFGDHFLERLLSDLGAVLRRDHDRIDTHGLSVAVFDGHLRLRVWPEEFELTRLAHVGQSLDELVRHLNRQGHQLFALVAREAEHHALVARALLLVGG